MATKKPGYDPGLNRQFDFPDPEEVTTVRLASERKETYRGLDMYRYHCNRTLI